MIGRIDIFSCRGEAYIRVTVFTDDNKLKYAFIVEASERIALPYIMKDIGITYVGFSDTISTDWYNALAYLYNEFEAI